MAQITLGQMYNAWETVSNWVKGLGGHTPKVAIVPPTKNAREPFSGSETVTHTFTTPMTGFCITHDGAETDPDLTFTIGNDTFTVKPGEVFSEDFDEFIEVTITTSSPYRAYGRG